MRGKGLIILAGLAATPVAAQSGANPVAMEKATPPEMARVVLETRGQVPLPRARPPLPAATAETAGPPTFQDIAADLDLDPAIITSKPTPCDERLDAMAKVTLKPRLIGPGACGGPDLVQVDAVLLPDKSAVRLHPAPMLQCRMAESLASWLRDEVAPRLAKLGSPLRAVENWDAYQCRSRNGIAGAKLSEHAKGDAIDLRSFQLADGRKITLTDPRADVPLREALRDTACARFTTVLGPGAPYHGEHIHLDAIQRSNGYRICHWDVREPAPPPLPRPRPAEVASAAPANAEPAQSERTGEEGPATARTQASRTDVTKPQDARAAKGSETAARDGAAAAPAKRADIVVARLPAGAGAGAADAAGAQSRILRIKPRPGVVGSQDDAGPGTDGGAAVPLPVPKPASLAKASAAHKRSRVRHRKHRYRAPFPFPFFHWR